MPDVRAIALLDTPAVDLGRRTVTADELGGRRAVLCLAVLAVQAGRSVSREVLAEAVWEATRPPSWRANLRAVISDLRRVLGDVVPGTTDGYRLDVPRTAVDVLTLEQRTLQVEAAAAAVAWEIASAVLPPADRMPLRGFDSEWSEHLRARVTELRGRLLGRAAEAALELGKARDARQLATELVTAFPLREDAHRLLMRAHAASGDRASALAAYAKCRALLNDQLGTLPDPQTAQMFLELLRTSPQLTVATVPPTEPAAAPGRSHAVAYAVTAARTAWDAGMYDDAARAASRGLAALSPHDSNSNEDTDARLQLQVLLGAARRQLGDPDGVRLLHSTVSDARGSGNPGVLADAALAFTARGAAGGEMYLSDTLLDVYGTALAELDPDDILRRAKLLSQMAGGLVWRGEGAAGRATAREAIALARAAGDDAGLLAVLASARQVITGALEFGFQEGLDAEITRRAAALDDPGARANAAVWRFTTAVERGDGSRLEELLHAAAGAAGDASSAATLHTLGYYQAALALLRGDLTSAAALADDAASAGRRGGLPEQVVEAIRLTQLVAVWQAGGRLAEHRDEVVGFFSAAELPEWSSVIALAEVAAGDDSAAREHLERYLDRYAETGPSGLSPVALAAMVARPIAHLRLEVAAARLYPLLAPYTGLGAFVVHFAGPVDLALGQLAHTLGDEERARAHFTAAARFATNLGAPLVAAECRESLTHSQERPVARPATDLPA